MRLGNSSTLRIIFATLLVSSTTFVISQAATVQIASADEVASTSTTVNTTDDLADFDPADGFCNTDESDDGGRCSLRAAIQHANASGAGLHEILLPGNQSYQLTIDGTDEDLSATGDLDIVSSIRISAQFADEDDDLPIIERIGSDRLFDVKNEGSLTLRHVALEEMDDAPDFGDDGAGIYNEGSVTIETIDRSYYDAATNFVATGNGGAIYNSGTLTIENHFEGSALNIIGNSANAGGAIFNAGTLTVNSETTGLSPGEISFVENSAGNGGAIYNTDQVEGGCGTGFANNVADEAGGALYGESSGFILLTSVEASDNTANVGGGIANIGSLELRQDESCGSETSISGNYAYAAGGGLFNAGSVEMGDSRFSSNSAGSGAGIFQAEEEDGDDYSTNVVGPVTFNWNAATDAGGAMLIESGTFSNVTAGDGSDPELTFENNSAGVAGAIGVGPPDEEMIFLTNTLFSENRAVLDEEVDGSGTAATIGSGGGQVFVSNSRFLSNAAETVGGVFFGTDGGSATFTNSTMQNNSATSGSVIYTTDVDSTALLQNTTLAYNASSAIAGTADTTTFKNSLVASDEDGICDVSVVADDYNAFGSGDCSTGETDIVDGGVDDLEEDEEGELVPNEGNPAIDIAGECSVDIDQLFNSRPIDGDGVDGAACDAGAIEARGAGSVIVSGSYLVPDGAYDGPLCVGAFDDGFEFFGIWLVEDGTYEVIGEPNQDIYIGFVPCTEDLNYDEDASWPGEWYKDVAFDPSDVNEDSGAQVVSIGEEASTIDVCIGGDDPTEACAEETPIITGSFQAPEGAYDGPVCVAAFDGDFEFFGIWLVEDGTYEVFGDNNQEVYIAFVPCTEDLNYDEDASWPGEWYKDVPFNPGDVNEDSGAQVLSIGEEASTIDVCIGGDNSEEECAEATSDTTTTTSAPIDPIPTTTAGPLPFAPVNDGVGNEGAERSSVPNSLAYTGAGTEPVINAALAGLFAGMILTLVSRRKRKAEGPGN